MIEIKPTGDPAAASLVVPFYESKVLRPRPWLLRVLAEHNPFYLLSAACMLASCLALSNTTTWNPIASSRLMQLIITLNVYEAALLAIALFLVARRGHARDGKMLLLLQAFFLADFTFLNAEIANDPQIGLIVNIVLFVLAGVKMGVVLRVLRPNFTMAQSGFVLLQLGLLFAIPCLLRWLNAINYPIGPRDFYGMWWLLAILPALYELVSRFDPQRGVPHFVSPGAEAAPTLTYVVLPYLSLATHLGILHYVYGVSYYGAHAAPALLGLTLVLHRVTPTMLVPRRDLAILRVLLPLAAIMVSANNPFEFPITRHFHGISWTPLHFAVEGAFLVYVFCFLRRRARFFLVTGAIVDTLYTLGPTRGQIGDWMKSGWDWSTTTSDRLMPKTLSDWGMIGLVASFAFLAIGFWLSLSKRSAVTNENDDADSG